MASHVVRRKRIHRVDIYNMIETALENQKTMMTDTAYVPLWKQKDNTYMPHFSTKRTWILIRQCNGILGFGFSMQPQNMLYAPG